MSFILYMLCLEHAGLLGTHYLYSYKATESPLMVLFSSFIRQTVLNLSYEDESTVQILCIGTDRSQQTVQTKIRLLLKKQSDQGLRCLPFHPHLLDALMQCYVKLFYFLGQLWQLFEVSQILEFLR